MNIIKKIIQVYWTRINWFHVKFLIVPRSLCVERANRANFLLLLGQFFVSIVRYVLHVPHSRLTHSRYYLTMKSKSQWTHSISIIIPCPSLLFPFFPPWKAIWGMQRARLSSIYYIEECIIVRWKLMRQVARVSRSPTVKILLSGLWMSSFALTFFFFFRFNWRQHSRPMYTYIYTRSLWRFMCR